MSFGRDWIPSLSCQRYSSLRRSPRRIASEQLEARSIRMVESRRLSSLPRVVEEQTVVEHVSQYLVLCWTKVGCG